MSIRYRNVPVAVEINIEQKIALVNHQQDERVKIGDTHVSNMPMNIYTVWHSDI